MPRYTLYPATELDVLAFHDKLTVCCVVAPDPLADSDAEAELLVKKEIFAETAPEAAGVNVRVKGAL